MMADVKCVNLQERFGHIYRITWDPAYDPDYRHVPKAKRDPWYMQTPCAGKGITIYPHGGGLLALECDNRYGIAKRVAALPGVTPWQDGSGEKTFLFPVAMFDQVAAIVKLRKRRRVTEAQRQAARERLAAYQFATK
jgi:hypothetical protein